MAEHQHQLHFDALDDNIQAIHHKTQAIHHGFTKLISSCAENTLLLRKILDLLPDSTNPNQPHDEPTVFDEMLERVNIVTTEIEPIRESSYIKDKVFAESSDDISGLASFEISSLILEDKDDLEGKAVVDKVFDEILKTTSDETWMFGGNDETELIDNEDKAIESQETLLNELRGGNRISVKNPFSINGHYQNQIGSKSFEMIGEHGVDSTERYNGVRSPNNLLESMNMYYGNSVGEYIARVTLKYFDPGGRYVSHAILVCLEPSTEYIFRSGSYVHIFSENWTRGYYSDGIESIDLVFDVIYKEVENCDCLRRFKTVMFCFSAFLSLLVSSIVAEPYTTTLIVHQLIAYADECMILNNEALYKTCFGALILTTFSLDVMTVLLFTASINRLLENGGHLKVLSMPLKLLKANLKIEDLFLVNTLFAKIGVLEVGECYISTRIIYIVCPYELYLYASSMLIFMAATHLRNYFRCLQELGRQKVYETYSANEWGGVYKVILGYRFGGSSMAFYDKNVDELYSGRQIATIAYVSLCGIERWGIMDCFLKFQKHRLGNLRFSLVFLLTEVLELLKWSYWFAWTTLVIDIEQENPPEEASNEFQQVTPRELVNSTSSLSLQPQAILDTRTIQRANFLVDQLLIQWEGLPVAEASWEGKDKLLQSFPSLNLEDKVIVDGEGNVVTTNEGLQQLNGLRRGTRARTGLRRLKDFMLYATSVADLSGE